MPEEELTTISARVQRSQFREVERIARQRGSDKSDVVRELLRIGIQQKRIEEALDLVRRGRATVWKAANHAQVTYREMLQLLREHNVPFPLSHEEIKREMEEIVSRK